MISYTTRFLHLANVARSLRALKPGVPEPVILKQIQDYSEADLSHSPVYTAPTK
jgi:hypothetical protein